MWFRRWLLAGSAHLVSMSDFSQDLKARADIAAIVGEFVVLKKSGSGWTGLCPFHSEKSPSFQVHSQKQFYYCFGCHAHGDVFQFLMQLQKLSFPEAVAAVAERLHIPLPEHSGGGEGGKERQELLRLHEEATQFFCRQLQAVEAASARAYLQDREVAPAALQRFQIGYAPDGGRTLSSFLRSRNYDPQLALTAGLCQLRRESALRQEQEEAAGGQLRPGATWDDIYDRFRGRVVFPICNDRGKVIAFGARAIHSDPARPAPKYLNSPETPVYTKGKVLYNLDKAREAIRRLGYFVLVEGYLDCISVFMAGFENVVASCGTALTSTQIALVARLGKNAVVNFDPDNAGSNAAERSIGLLLEENFQIRVVTLPGGLDPDLFIRKNGAEGYKQQLAQSRPYFDYLLERARKNFDVRRPEAKVAAMAFLMPYINRVQDAIVRSEMADQMAHQLGLESDVVRQEIRQASRQRRSRLNATPEAAATLLESEQLILRAWLEWDEHRATITGLLQQEQLLEGLASQALFEQLLQRHSQEKSLDVSAIATELPEPDRRLLAQILMGQGEQLSEPAVAGAVEALRDRRLDLRRRDLNSRMLAASQSGDREAVQEIYRERQELDREFAERRSRFEIRRQ